MLTSCNISFTVDNHHISDGGGDAYSQINVLPSIFSLHGGGSLADPGKGKGPQCKYRDLNSNKIVSYDCDRFQSKGDIDSITPQLKIISPEAGEVIDYSLLTDSNGNGTVELPITIVISPDSDYTVDFTAAANAPARSMLSYLKSTV